MKEDFEDFCVALPRDLLQAFRTIAANKGDEPDSVLTHLIQAYVGRHKETSLVRTSGVIEVYVKSVLNQWMDWPPARELEADEFIELTIEKIHQKLVVTDDQARIVAFRVWQELWKASDEVKISSESDTAPGNQTPL